MRDYTLTYYQSIACHYALTYLNESAHTL